MSLIVSKGKSLVGQFLRNRAYWAVKLKDGSWVCELDPVTNFRRAEQRTLDWSLDIVGTGDVKRIDELWLFCPRSKTSPGGNTARLKITEPGTAFVLKVGHVSIERRQATAVMIGRVENKLTGDCVCFIWDSVMKAMSQPWYSNVYHLGTWREGVAPLGRLAFDVVGLDLR